MEYEFVGYWMFVEMDFEHALQRLSFCWEKSEAINNERMYEICMPNNLSPIQLKSNRDFDRFSHTILLFFLSNAM